MKKTLVYLLTFITVFSFTAIMYAGSAFAGEVSLEITGGLDVDKEKSSTFDSSKTISGTADEGTVIEITVYKKLSNDKLKEMDTYTVEVGESGLFSQPVELYIGENVIDFSAGLEDCENIEMETTVTRKNKEIKAKLESSIYVPGGSSAY